MLTQECSSSQSFDIFNGQPIPQAQFADQSMGQISGSVCELCEDAALELTLSAFVFIAFRVSQLGKIAQLPPLRVTHPGHSNKMVTGLKSQVIQSGMHSSLAWLGLGGK